MAALRLPVPCGQRAFCFQRMNELIDTCNRSSRFASDPDAKQEIAEVAYHRIRPDVAVAY
jgi:hypothetical protein